MNTYTWTFSELDVDPSCLGFTDVVRRAVCQLHATDGLGGTAEQVHKVRLQDPTSETFTAFADLTHDQLATWVEEALGSLQLEAIKQWLDKVLLEQSFVKTVPPWV
jgi:hypothetical protein